MLSGGMGGCAIWFFEEAGIQIASEENGFVRKALGGVLPSVISENGDQLDYTTRKFSIPFTISSIQTSFTCRCNGKGGSSIGLFDRNSRYC